jgi:3-hydroxybutyryl-CoA dehydrogenase
MRPEDVRRAGVVGCGLMGSGIAEVLAGAGIDVAFVEATDELVAGGHERIRASVDRAVERDKLAPEDRRGLLDRVHGSTDLASLHDVDLVIEAATEDEEAKREVFRRLGQLTRSEVVLATNTSSIPIVGLAAASGRPDRVIGMHFFNPPPVMKLLELIPALTTSEETIAFARGIGARIGKTVVQSTDRAGFIVNRLLIPYLNAAARALDEGVASREDLDTAIRLGLAHPMGPLSLMDLIGIDTVVAISEVLHAEFAEPQYAPAPLLRRMVAAGRLGRKAGGGFYDYPG